AAAFRPRLAISHACLPAPACRVWPNPEHVSQRKLPGQCRHGKLLRYAEVRILLSEPLRERRAASGWHPPIHSLLQPRTNQNKTKRPESSAIPYSGLGRLICNRPTSGGQFILRPFLNVCSPCAYHIDDSPHLLRPDHVAFATVSNVSEPSYKRRPSRIVTDWPSS